MSLMIVRLQSLIVVFPIVSITALPHARSGAQGCGPQDPDVRAVLDLEDGWARAVVRRDSTTFERLLADGFVYTENDRMESRGDVIHDVVAGADTVRAAHNEAMQVHCFGPTAVVTGWLVLEGRGAGGAFLRRYRFTDTWVRQAGRWRIVAAQDFVAPH
jgi:ketosteroid isomerase-like protein